MKRLQRIAITIGALTTAGTAFAQTDSYSAPQPTTVAEDRPVERREPRTWNHFDLGVSGGFNSPGGIVGAEAEFRPIRFLGIRASGCIGAWGGRISPGLRVYGWLGQWGGVFIDGALAMNLGGPIRIAVGERAWAVERDFTATAIPALGGKLRLGPVFFEARVGYAFRLKQDNYRITEGDPNDPVLVGAVNAAQHEGIAASGMFGVNFL